MSTRKATKPARKPAKKPDIKSSGRGGRAKASPTARRKAAKATAQAKATGAVGKYGTQAQRAMRDNAIVSRLLAGETQKEVGKLFGITERMVNRIAKRHGSRPTIFDKVPMDIAESYSRDLEGLLRDFDALAYEHADANPNVAVGALKGKLTTLEHLMELASHAGKLPTNLELFRVESVLRQMAEDMALTMGRVKRGEISAEDAHEHFVELAARADSDQRQKALPA